MSDPVTVYVELLDEGSRAWRPTIAYPIGGERYVLTNQNHDSETETWAVAPGSIITILRMKTETAEFGVATAIEPAK